jgi:phosphatidylinositol-bisphosphatase
VCIRVEGGGDVVVPVSAVYQRSCYGMPLTWLVHCAGPARTTLPPRLPMLMQPAQPAVADSAAATASSSASSAAVSSTAAGAAPPGTGAAASLPLPVPAELWRLIDTLDAQHLDTPGLFVVNGNAREMILIREALDVGMHFPPNLTAHSYAESLVRFLELLHEPVFPAALAHAYADTGLPLGTFCHNALQLLPPAHYNTFVYVVSFLRKVLQRAAANQLSPVQLVLVFAGCLMQEDVAVTTSGAAAAGEGAYAPLIVLKHYITSHEFE